MAVPLDAIRAFHNAFRKDMREMDEAAHDAARGHGGLDEVLRRYAFFNEILAWHASGEEDFVFPALENAAPLVAEAYERDHRGLDTLSEWLTRAVSASNTLEIARASAAFDFHLSIHLNKEEAHLYRILNERISLPNQGAIVGSMAQKIPQPRHPQVVTWLFPLIRPGDRENMVRLWQQVLPVHQFAATKKLIQAAIGDDWVELANRVPELK